MYSVCNTVLYTVLYTILHTVMSIILYTLKYTNIRVTVGACFLSKNTPLHHNEYCIEHYTVQFTVKSTLYLLCIVLSVLKYHSSFSKLLTMYLTWFCLVNIKLYCTPLCTQTFKWLAELAFTVYKLYSDMQSSYSILKIVLNIILYTVLNI